MPTAPAISERGIGMLLSLSKSSTSTALDLSEYALLFFGLVLVVGIFGEYKKVPKRFARWPKELFEILVMVGVAGELLGDGGVFLFSHRLQTLEGADIQALDVKAEKAGSKATNALTKSGMALSQAGAANDAAKGAVDKSGKAVKTAANAMRLARGARQEADSFAKDINEAKRDALEAKTLLSEVRQLAKEAQERASSAEKGTERLTTRFADRLLTDAQVQAIGAALKSFAGQEWEVTTYWDIPECINISNRILAALQIARWKYIPPEGFHALFGGVVGVLVYVHPSPPNGNVRLAADALVSALNANGITAQLRLENAKNTPSNRITLSIGTKN